MTKFGKRIVQRTIFSYDFTFINQLREEHEPLRGARKFECMSDHRKSFFVKILYGQSDHESFRIGGHYFAYFACC